MAATLQEHVDTRWADIQARAAAMGIQVAPHPRLLQTLADEHAIHAAREADRPGIAYLTLDVFKQASAKHKGLAKRPEYPPAPQGIYAYDSALAVAADLPDAYDARSDGYIGNVKDQGQCGSCHIFSGIFAAEVADALSNGTNKPGIGSPNNWSEQALIDCNPNLGGCNGGLPELDIDAIISRGTVDTKLDPYQAQDNANPCPQSRPRTVKGREWVGAGSNGNSVPAGIDIANAIFLKKGLSVCVAADDLFMAYAGGVFTGNPALGPNDIDHAVAFVAYRKSVSHPGKYEFLLRNSWNTSWGIGGYMWCLEGASLAGWGAFYAIGVGNAPAPSPAPQPAPVPIPQGWRFIGDPVHVGVFGGTFTPSGKIVPVTGGVSTNWFSLVMDLRAIVADVQAVDAAGMIAAVKKLIEDGKAHNWPAVEADVMDLVGRLSQGNWAPLIADAQKVLADLGVRTASGQMGAFDWKSFLMALIQAWLAGGGGLHAKAPCGCK